MLDALLAMTILAAAPPKVLYKPAPTAGADVGTVELVTPRRNPCFGIVRVSMLLSSRKSDRNRAYVLSVTVADAISPPIITEGALGGDKLKVVNVRNGDVACTDYQCPTGSAAVFEVSEDQRQALLTAGSLPLLVKTSLASNCVVDMPIEKVVPETLAAWAEKLPPAAG